MPETTTKTESTTTPTAADLAVQASLEAKAVADKAQVEKTAASIAAAKPDFAAEEARIAALPEAERVAATEKLTAEKEKRKAAEVAAAGAVTQKVVPEKYDLKIPKGSTLNAASLERIAATARART